MIALKLPNLWVQLGIRNLEAAASAEAAGIRVVMDRCILIEHARLARR
jgi:predicted CoA-binding protein